MLSDQQSYIQPQLHEEDNRNLQITQTHRTLKLLRTFLLIIMQHYKHLFKETSQVPLITHPESNSNVSKPNSINRKTSLYTQLPNQARSWVQSHLSTMAESAEMHMTRDHSSGAPISPFHNSLQQQSPWESSKREEQLWSLRSRQDKYLSVIDTHQT